MIQNIFLAEIHTDWVFSYGGQNSANPVEQIFLIVLKMGKNISSKYRLVVKTKLLMLTNQIKT